MVFVSVSLETTPKPRASSKKKASHPPTGPIKPGKKQTKKRQVASSPGTWIQISGLSRCGHPETKNPPREDRNTTPLKLFAPETQTNQKNKYPQHVVSGTNNEKTKNISPACRRCREDEGRPRLQALGFGFLWQALVVIEVFRANLLASAEMDRHISGCGWVVTKGRLQQRLSTHKHATNMDIYIYMVVKYMDSQFVGFSEASPTRKRPKGTWEAK